MKKHSICWLDFIMGALAASVIWLFVYAVAVVPDVYTKTSVASNDVEKASDADEVVNTTISQYMTGIKSCKFSWDNGENVTLYTPDKFYSLTDQYLDEMSSYYSVPFEGLEKTYIVGDSEDSSSCTIMLNAAAMSDVDKMLTSVYGAEAEDEKTYSEAFRYLRDGELPDELPDGYKLVDLGTISANGVDYHVFDIQYSVSYTYYEDDDIDKQNPKETSIVYYELAAYSSTEDAVEIITYMTDYDVNKAYAYLCEFVGYEYNGTLPESNIVIDNSLTEEVATDGEN